MRPSVLPNLLSAAARNQSRGLERISACSRSAPRFFGAQPGEQEVVAAGIRVGQNHERHWAEPPRPVDVVRRPRRCAGRARRLQDQRRCAARGRRGPDALPPGPPRPADARAADRARRVRRAAPGDPARAGHRRPRGRLRGVPRPPAAGPRARPRARGRRSRPRRSSRSTATSPSWSRTRSPAESLLAAVRAADKALIREVALFDVYSGAGPRRGHEVARGRGPPPGAGPHADRARDRGRGQEDHRRRRQGHRRRCCAAEARSSLARDRVMTYIPCDMRLRARCRRAGRRDPEPAWGVGGLASCGLRREVELLASVPLMLQYESVAAATGTAGVQRLQHARSCTSCWMRSRWSRRG